MNGVHTQRWPPRRPPMGQRVPPGVKKPQARKEGPTRSAKGPLATKDVPTRPVLVPIRRRDAFWATVVNTIVLTLLALFLYYLYTLWLPEGLPQQIVYHVILAMTVLAVILFAGSLFLFVLPRLVGLRGPPGSPRPGND